MLSLFENFLAELIYLYSSTTYISKQFTPIYSSPYSSKQMEFFYGILISIHLSTSGTQKPLRFEAQGPSCYNISDRKRCRKKHNESPTHLSCEVIFVLSASALSFFLFYVVRSKMILVLINCQFLFALPVFFYVSAKHLSRKVYFILFLPT